MLATLSLALSLVTLAIAAGLAVLLHRARRARGELAQRLHDHALALDRRCDVLQSQLDQVALHHRVDHLLDLVSVSERHGCIATAAARRLERVALDLREEARQAAEAG